jgi:hypothetical protein
MKSFDLAASKLQVGENQVMVVGDALTKEQIASMSASLANPLIVVCTNALKACSFASSLVISWASILLAFVNSGCTRNKQNWLRGKQNLHYR